MVGFSDRSTHELSEVEVQPTPDSYFYKREMHSKNRKSRTTASEIS
ncbi:hypothetical protein CKA32_001204 [Geitlerinema sp. FC II]|nr:hypothetical protein CKA32_001204 [Geitlerinema sp. FC II]